MSVLACNRTGCKNIMCNRYSNHHGYICNECFTELSLKKGISIYEFMDSYKESELDGVDWWLEELNNEFKTED